MYFCTGMKKIALFLAVVLFVGTLDAQHFVQSVSSLLTPVLSVEKVGEGQPDCCQVSYKDTAEKISTCSANESDQETKDCCQGSNCDCNCCNHLVLFSQSLLDFAFYPVDFAEDFHYSDLRNHNFVGSVFIPPSIT